MRPTTSSMLQQNNNNNYPCLNVSGSTREMLQKCSRATLPFPSRLELGLGDLPLIRGLRAWALCSKNRRRAGSLLGGGQAPTAPPVGLSGSTSCPRPADVYLSGEWGRMGYGLPLGMDDRQAGIGALVTVATLKTSEGGGKTQTQCLFLRTEKGSCLYSTAKPSSGVTTSAASSVVGGWLRGKTGGGGRDIPAGRRDNGPTTPAHTGVNRVRVRSGRRWRKSGNAVTREKNVVSREKQQSSREDPAGEITLEERQEERDKGGLASKQQHDGRRVRQEKEGACRSVQCGGRAQRRASQDELEGGESPRRAASSRLNSEGKDMRKERQNNEEAKPNPDLESNHAYPESHSDCGVEEIRDAESNEEQMTQTSHSKDDYSEREEDTNSEVMKTHTGNNDLIHSHSGQPTDDLASFPDQVEASQESEKETESVDVEKEEGSISETPADFPVVSDWCEDISVSTIRTAVSPEPSSPVEGRACSADHEACGVWREQENRENHLEGTHQTANPALVGKEELDANRFEQKDDENRNRQPQFFCQNVGNCSESKESEASSSLLGQRDPSISETDRRIATGNSCNYSGNGLNGAERRDELVWGNREENIEVRVNPEEGGDTCNESDNGKGKGNEDKEEQMSKDDSTLQPNNDTERTRNCALKDSWRLEESNADECRGRKKDVGHTCGQTSITPAEANGESSANVTDVATADPSTSLALSLANPAPSLPPLGSMATGLPCLEAKEEEKEGVGVSAGDGKGGQEGNGRLGQQQQEERASTVATEQERKEKEQEKEEDEFGVFMQAEGEPVWSEGYTMSASVPCGNRESVALGDHGISGESTHWTPGWTGSSFHQSDDSWSAFPQDSSDKGGDVLGQWWPTSAVESNQTLAAAFAEAFPSSPASSSSDPCNLDTVPTLTQLLRDRASQDQGLLDSFHDLNKMICQRYKRANSVSRDLLLRTLHLDQPYTESRQAPWTANRRLSPGLPSANQHAQNAAAKRRLSYDYNRNVVE